ncbi:MAG: BMC domain-containing protein [Hungatella sp.]|jgi:microcompartment protein CcmL/EutN|nr:BMC domain-containing protein [Hungatella sp.]
MEDALGIIEIQGLATAVTVADVMVKTAAVRIINTEKGQGCGWVIVKVTGNVGAVNASIHAGIQAAKEYGGYIASKVIPRPADQVFELIREEKAKTETFKEPAAKPEKPVSIPEIEVKPVMETKKPASDAKEEEKPVTQLEKPASNSEKKEKPAPIPRDVVETVAEKEPKSEPPAQPVPNQDKPIKSGSSKSKSKDNGHSEKSSKVVESRELDKRSDEVSDQNI